MVAKGQGGFGKRWTRSLGLADTKLHIERINNKVLIYSTENYIQYTVINHNGKEYRKRMYVISESVVSHSVVFDSLQLHGL